MKQKVATAMMTGMVVAVLTLILIFMNLLVAQLPPLRIDLTANKQYSLSEATKKVVGRLEDRIKVEAYFTKELPAPYNRHATYLRDLLEEYAVYARGNLTFEFIDPGNEDAKKREMMMKGIMPVQIQEIRDDQIGIKQGFMGVVVLYGTRKEAIPVVRETDNLEYELTSIIRKLAAQELKTLAFASGHGEAVPDEKMQKVRAELEKNYKVITHDFKTAKEVPPHVSTMAIVGPTEKWTDEHLFYLDQFIMRGGTAAFLLDAVKVDLHQLSGAQDIDHGLTELLASYGITPGKDLILDPHCSRINVETQQGPFRVRNVVNYPYFPNLTDLNRDHILSRDIGSLTLPFLSSLTVASNRPGISYTVLARTSDKSWKETGRYALNPLEPKARPQSAVKGPFNAAVIATGKFTSFFANKPKDAGAEYIKDPAQVLKESPETRILVVGDASLAQDDFGDQNASAFCINAVDWLAQDSEMIKIRNRGLSEKPIPEMTPGFKQFVRYGNMLGVPFLFILFGMARWQWRKARLRNFRL